MSCLVLYFLFSSWFCLMCYGQNVFTITRTSTKPPFNDNDMFKVPQSVSCTDSGSHCKSYHEVAFATQKKCTCKCPYGSSTFGFFGNSWKCLDNKDIRTQAGCTKRFAQEQNSYPFKVIKADSSLDYVVLKGKNCKIDLPSSRYLTCSGTWAKLDPDISNQHISSSLNEKKINGGNYKYFFTIKQPPPTLEGQFISLSFKCPKVQCLLFKVAGVTKCNAGEGPRNVITDPTPSTNHVSTTLIQPQAPTKSNQASSPKETSSGVIAAVVIIIILIIFIVIIVGYIFWKRRRGERIWLLDQCSHIVRKARTPLSRSPKTKKTVEENNYNDENIYAEIPELPNFTFVEGRTTSPGKGAPFLTTNGTHYPGQETQDTSLRRGRRSLTDEIGYAVPVEFEDDHDQGYSKTNSSSFQNGTHDHARAQVYQSDTDGYAVPEPELHGYDALQQKSTSKRPDVHVGNTQGRKQDRCFTADEEGYTVPGTDLPEYDVLEEPDGEVMDDNSSERNHEHLAACDDNYAVPETDLPEETNGFDGLPETDSRNQQGGRATENAIKYSNQKEEGGNTTSNPRRTRRRPPSPPRAIDRVVHDV